MRLKCLTKWIIALCLKPAWALNCQAVLQPFTAEYEVYFHGMPIGTSIHRLESQGACYHASSLSRPHWTGIPFYDEQSSWFELHAGRIRPLKYQYQKREKQHSRTGYFLFTDQRAEHFSQQHQTLQVPIHIQDMISHLFQLRCDLAQQKTPLHYTVLTDKGLKTYHFEHLPQETLQSPWGPVQAHKLTLTEGPKQRQTLIWLAPTPPYLMLKMQQIRKGKVTFTAKLKDFPAS